MLTDAELLEIVDELTCNGPRGSCQGCGAEMVVTYHEEDGSPDVSWQPHRTGCWVRLYLDLHRPRAKRREPEPA